MALPDKFYDRARHIEIIVAGKREHRLRLQRAAMVAMRMRRQREVVSISEALLTAREAMILEQTFIANIEEVVADLALSANKDA